jgi:hypothetical protein
MTQPDAYRTAAREAQCVIDKARGRDPDADLAPLPLSSQKSLRIVLTMDGRIPIVCLDANGNINWSWITHLAIGIG